MHACIQPRGMIISQSNSRDFYRPFQVILFPCAVFRSKMGTGNSTTSAALTSSSEGSDSSWLKKNLPFMCTLLFIYIVGIASH